VPASDRWIREGAVEGLALAGTFALMSGFPRALSIGLPEGRTLMVTAHPPVRGQPVRITPMARIARRFFDACPICGEEATEAEHVPPASIGGRVMTRTCAPCNNKLGSNVEADLADWNDGALTLPRFSADVIAGARRSSRILCRRPPDGSFVLVVDGNIDSAVRDMLESGQVDLRALLPDTNRVRLGLLKHSFLSACLYGGLLEGPDAEAVRVDLLAARDAGSRREVPASRLALGLTVLRSDDGPLLDWPVVHAIGEIDGDRTEGVVLGGTIFVSWSSAPTKQPPEQLPLNVSFEVGGRLKGVIRSPDG
jgi:hypothetical protein